LLALRMLLLPVMYVLLRILLQSLLVLTGCM